MTKMMSRRSPILSSPLCLCDTMTATSIEQLLCHDALRSMLSKARSGRAKACLLPSSVGHVCRHALEEWKKQRQIRLKSRAEWSAEVETATGWESQDSVGRGGS